MNKLKVLITTLLVMSMGAIAAPDSMVPGHFTENNRNIMPKNELENNIGANNSNNAPMVLKGVKIAKEGEKVHPTEEFFNALISCTAGNYYEENRMADILGNMFLSHTIFGKDQNQCYAELQAPNSHVWHCSFSFEQLNEIDDQYMVEGLIEYNIKSPSPKSMRSEIDWGQIKARSCILDK